MGNKTIDVMRLSASRPEFLERSTWSILKRVRYSGPFRWLFHEDVFYKEASEKCLNMAKDLFKFDVVGESDPPIGHGASLTWLLDRTTADYVLNWEDDQETVRDIDLDPLVAVMDKHDKINQIAFHKRKIEYEHHGWKMHEIELDGVHFVTNPHWAYVPALWRASYIKPRWGRFTSKQHHWEQNAHLKGIAFNSNEMRPPEWVMENTKTYYLGRFAEPGYIIHIGSGHSLRVGSYRCQE